jgi:DNA repair exonuclease SbcCD ATPase subunit
MSETLKLRTTTFGGFHRQDVVDYIESTAREHAAQLNALRAELKQAQEQLHALEGEKTRADALELRCQELSARVDELSPLEEEVTTLRTQVEEYRPQAEAYGELKESVASIELDARTRAAQLVQEAEEDSANKRKKAQELLDQVLSEYSQVGNGANAAISDAICKLTDVRASLSRLGELRTQLKEAEHE